MSAITWDDHLLARYRAGCQDAFNDLYAKYQPILLRWLKLRTTEQTAEDVCQQVWIVISQHTEQISGDDGFRKWIKSIARNHYRSATRKVRWLKCDNELDPIDHREQTPGNELLQADEAQIIHGAVAGLPDRQKLAVELLASGLSTAEVATLLAVKVRDIQLRRREAEKLLGFLKY